VRNYSRASDADHIGAVPIIRQGRIEAAFGAWDEEADDPIHACMRRVWIKEHQVYVSANSPDVSRARDVGVYTGEFCETLLEVYAQTQTFPTPEVVSQIGDHILAKPSYRRWPKTTLASAKAAGLEFAHGYLDRLGDEDDPLEGKPPIWVLRRQHEFRLSRQHDGRKCWIIIVRPDLVVATRDALVAYEFSTSRRPDNVADVRTALNFWALFRERERREAWQSRARILTRVEQLALASGYTEELAHEAATNWRESIASVADSLVDEDYEPNVHHSRCFDCPWFTQCAPRFEPEDLASDLWLSLTTLEADAN
jgi:hypothetical protein